MASEPGKLAGRSLLVAACRAPLRLRGLVLLPVLVAALGLQEYGLYVTFRVLEALLVAAACMGLQDSLFRFLPRDRDARSRGRTFATVFAAVQGAAIVLAGALAAAALPASRLWGVARAPLYLIAGITLARIPGVLCEVYFRARERTGASLGLWSLAAYGEIAVVGFSACYGGTVTSVLVALLAWHGLCAILSAGLLLGFGDLQWARPAWRTARRHLRFSIPLVPLHLSNWVIHSSDRVMIAILAGSVYVAYYNPAYLLGSLVLLIPEIVGVFLPVMLARLHENHGAQSARDLLNVALNAFLLLAVPCFFGTALVAPPLLAMLVGAEAAAAGSPVVLLITGACILFGAARLYAEVLKLERRTAAAGRVWIAGAALNLTANAALIPLWNAYGAALATLASAVLVCGLMVRAATRHRAMVPDVRLALCAVAAAGAMGLVVWLLPRASPSLLAASVSAGVVAYGAFLLGLQYLVCSTTGAILSGLRQGTAPPSRG